MEAGSGITGIVLYGAGAVTAAAFAGRLWWKKCGGTECAGERSGMKKGGMERSGVKKGGRGTTSLQMPYSREGVFSLMRENGRAAAGGGSGDLCGTSGGRYAGRGRDEGKPAVHFYFQ